MLPHNAGDVGKSLVFCKAPDCMMGEKKRTRKSHKGKGQDRARLCSVHRHCKAETESWPPSEPVQYQTAPDLRSIQRTCKEPDHTVQPDTPASKQQNSEKIIFIQVINDILLITPVQKDLDAVFTHPQTSQEQAEENGYFYFKFGVSVILSHSVEDPPITCNRGGLHFPMHRRL
ncbi:hypothetical protein PAMP_013086 [Pampus punctatissimus]